MNVLITSAIAATLIIGAFGIVEMFFYFHKSSREDEISKLDSQLKTVREIKKAERSSALTKYGD